MSGVKCCNCGKKIAEKISIQRGYIEITCKCGVVNKIEAEGPQPCEIRKTSYTDKVSRGIEKK